MTREEAAKKINWLYYEANYGSNLPDDIEVAVDMAIEALSQPEQRIGKWEMDKEGNCYCSECGLHYDSWAKGLKYCPNCGTKMEETKDV